MIYDPCSRSSVVRPGKDPTLVWVIKTDLLVGAAHISGPCLPSNVAENHKGVSLAPFLRLKPRSQLNFYVHLLLSSRTCPYLHTLCALLPYTELNSQCISAGWVSASAQPSRQDLTFVLTLCAWIVYLTHCTETALQPYKGGVGYQSQMRKPRFTELSDQFEVTKLQSSRTRWHTSPEVHNAKTLPSLPAASQDQLSSARFL